MPCPFGVCSLAMFGLPAMYKAAKSLEPNQAVALALLVPLLAVVVAMVVAPDVVTSNFNCVCECSTMKSTAMGVGALYLCGVKSLSEGSAAPKVEEKMA
jgi:hypothetical protein